jgi:YggT family protein
MDVVNVVRIIFEIYSYMIIGYIILSWVPGARENQLGQLLARVVEPYLGFFRRFIPPLGMLDLSPIVAILALQFIQVGALTVVGRIIG